MSSWLQSLIDNVADKGATAIMRAVNGRHVVYALLIVFSAILALGGMGFVAVGGYLSLREGHSSWISGLIVGGVILSIALIAILLLWLSMRGRRYPQSVPEQNGQTVSESIPVDNITHLGEVVGNHLSERGVRPTDVMIAALAAGTVLGAGPALRRRRRRKQPNRRSTVSADHSRPRKRHQT